MSSRNARRGGAKSRQAADQEDSDEEIMQTDEEKREIRRKLRMLREKLGENKDKIKRGADNEEIKQMLDEAKNIVNNIKGTQEAIEDAKWFKDLCQFVRELSEDTNTNERKFHVEEYAEKIGSHANASRDTRSNIRMTKNQCLGLGENFSRYFKRTPGFTFILGAIDTEAGEEKTRRQREKKVVRDRIVAPTKTAIIERSQAADGQKTAKLVDSTMQFLEKEYKKNGRKPVNYFKFLIDPASFGNTVENMFHVSFLVKQRRVELSVCERIGLPVLRPVSGSGDGEEGEAEGKNQAIISLSYDDWENLKDALNITSAAIVHKVS